MNASEPCMCTVVQDEMEKLRVCETLVELTHAVDVGQLMFPPPALPSTVCDGQPERGPYRCACITKLFSAWAAKCDRCVGYY